MTHGGGRAILWSSFNQARKLTDNASGKSSEFFFGAARERVKQLRRAGSTLVETTVYAGGLYEKVVTAASGLVEHKHYIVAPTGRIAVHTERSDFTKDTRFFHTDGLGSVTVVTDERGQVLKRYAYDAWGKQSTLFTATGSGISNTAPSTRGYTDHEMLSDLGLIHMNGRVYDPTLGRFLSADPHIDDARDSQGYNRYSYVGNNPMNATDPSGYFKLKDALKIVAIVVVSYFTAGAALYLSGGVTGVATGATATFGNALAALAGTGGFGVTLGGAIAAGAGAGFASGFAGSLLNGGSIGHAFKAGIIGGLMGGITGGLAHGIGQLAHAGKIGFLEHAGAHGLVQGAAAEVTGGEFRHGFYAGFVGAASGPTIQGLTKNAYSRVAVAAVVGGTASAVGGGRFANGAISSAFAFMLNEAQGEIFEENGKAVRITGANPEFTPADRNPREYSKWSSGAKETARKLDEVGKVMVKLFSGRLRRSGFEGQKGPNPGSVASGLVPSAIENLTIELSASFADLGIREMGSIHSMVSYQERRSFGIFKYWNKNTIDYELVRNPTGFPSDTVWSGSSIRNTSTWVNNYIYTAIGQSEAILDSKLR